MKKTDKDKPKRLDVKDVPFEKIVNGFLKVKPPERKKPKKNKGIDKKD